MPPLMVRIPYTPELVSCSSKHLDEYFHLSLHSKPFLSKDMKRIVGKAQLLRAEVFRTQSKGK